MRKLLLLLALFCVSIGTWADEIDLGNGSKVTFQYIEGQDWNTYAKMILVNESDFANWYYSDANSGQLDNVISKLRFDNSSSVKSAKIPMKNDYPNSYIKLSANGDWEAPSIEIHTDNTDSQSALSIWLNNTRNSSLFSCADMNKLTITGKNPHWNYENGSNKGVVTLQIGNDGKPYLDIEVQNGSATGIYNSFVSDNSLFSSMPGRIFINDANTSYIDLAGNSATVTSANVNDFATWVANHSDALSSVTNYTFNGNAKFTTTTDGDANYVVINGNTATATCTDNSASLHTWANANGAYLNNVQTVNFSSETTIYLTDPADETKRVVVNGNNVTVYCEDVADYNSWKNNSLNSKIINGKTVKTVGMKMKLSDGCYIEFSEDGKKAYVHAQHEGCLTSLYDTYIAPYGNPNTSSFPDGTILVFGNDCVLSSSDVTKVLCGGGGQWKLSFDFFDVTNNGQMTVAAIDAAINAGVESMASSYKSQYGIILPYNSTIGTSAMIRSNGNSNGDGSTFTKYAAYYRESETAKNLTLHVWDRTYWNGWGNDAANSYAAAAAQLNTHNEVKNAETVTVSTLTNTSFDLSKLDASKVKIEITNDDMIKDVWNQSAPKTDIPSLADIYVVSSVPGGFYSNVETTGTEETPTNLLKISGQISSSDLAAISDFTDGPRVLDLREASVQGGITKALLGSITNDNIEYILLPEGMSKDVVCGADYSDMEGLKAVISSNSTDLVAYVKQAGSLAEARVLATGGTTSTVNVNGVAYPIFTPTTQNLQNVTLAGNLNASDLAARVNQQSAVSAVDGHLYSDASFVTSGGTAAAATDNGYTTKSGVVEGSSGLNGDSSIKSLDLTNAVFDNNNDMNFNLLGLTKLENIKLPIDDEKMKTIPLGCFNNNHDMTYICIPCNYTTIGRYAFSDNTVTCITTDNPSHTLVVGGTGETFVSEEEAKEALANTFTFSQNIASIGRGAFIINNEVITDVYVMATTTPLCEKDAFSGPMLYGNNGFEGTGPYCRDKYVNGGKKITMLHYPSGDINNETYKRMEELYTDVYKIYTKKEQTGAIDANGRTIAWPTHQEMKRVFEQASVSKTWHEWKTGYDTNQQVNNTESTEGYTVDNTISFGTPTYNFEGYEGWHQFTLAMANYYEPAEKKEDDKIVREYEDAGWYTFCIPFNMTYKQVVEMLGVPKSTENVINKLNGEEVTADIMPDIRQLSSVTRKKGEGKNNNIVMLRMTPNLWEKPTAGYTGYLQITHNPNSVTTQLVSAEPYNASSTIDDRLSLIGGRPYIIKAYKRKQVVDGVDQFKIKGQNLGKYVLERYADQFGIESSIVQNTTYESYECYEQLGGGNLETLRFAKPYEDHRVQATRDGDKSAYLTYETTEGGETVTKKYYYTMVGQFWQQPLPQYCLYMSKGNWYRYTNVPENIEDRYTWDPYKCIIMATVEVTGTKGAGYRDEEASVYPQVVEGTTDKLEKTFSLTFLDGRDDDDFGATGTSAKYIFAFDDEGIIELDEDGNEVTAIKQLDGEMVATPVNTKVYNMAGQYVGNSLQGLSKGLYIVNGKKIIVK